MALVACRECAREISDQAATCPHCGLTVDAKGRGTAMTTPSSSRAAPSPRSSNRNRVWILAIVLAVVAGGAGIFINSREAKERVVDAEERVANAENKAQEARYRAEHERLRAAEAAEAAMPRVVDQACTYHPVPLGDDYAQVSCVVHNPGQQVAAARVVASLSRFNKEPIERTKDVAIPAGERVAVDIRFNEAGEGDKKIECQCSLAR